MCASRQNFDFIFSKDIKLVYYVDPNLVILAGRLLPKTDLIDNLQCSLVLLVFMGSSAPKCMQFIVRSVVRAVVHNLSSPLVLIYIIEIVIYVSSCIMLIFILRVISNFTRYIRKHESLRAQLSCNNILYVPLIL